MADSTPVLDITTKTARQFVRIDGAKYELRSPNDIGLDEYQTLIRIGPRIAELLALTTRDSADSSELGEILSEATRLALLAPNAVVKRLGQVEQVMVVTAFLEPSAKRMQELGRLIGRPASPSNGQKPSLDLPGSTAAARSAGRKSRSASSGRT